MQFPVIQENTDLQQAVDAKQLYQALGLDSTNWAGWSKNNIANNPFALEGTDYGVYGLGTNTQGGRPTTNYYLSIDFAKKLAMQVRTEMGERIRDYFIDCERRATSASQPVMAMPDFTNPAEAARAFADQYEAKQIAQEQLALAQPKVKFYDTVAASSATMAVGDVAKKIGMSAQELNKKLIEIGAYDKRRLPKKVFNDGFIRKGYAEMSLTQDGYDRNRLTQAGQIYVTGLFGRSREVESM